MTDKKMNVTYVKDMDSLIRGNVIENNVFMNFNGLKVSFELMEKQEYKNVTAIPIKTDKFAKKDFITVKKGYEMGLVEIKELEKSSVKTVVCKNYAVVPLLLIEGDEITGAMQNRIINDSMLIPAKSIKKISVSCTEHGRWKSEGNNLFAPSEYSLNSDTRERRRSAVLENRDYQSEVWNSISDLEMSHDFRSNTSALHDNYDNSKSLQDDYLEHFNIEEGQNGVIFFINGEFKGIELFYNHSIYKEYHEKTFRSYIIDALVNEDKEFEKTDGDELTKKIIGIFENISSSKFKKYETVGLGENIKFNNEIGTGAGLIFEGELIHMSYSISEDIIKDKDYGIIL